jgi:hypothetical protein
MTEISLQISLPSISLFPLLACLAFLTLFTTCYLTSKGLAMILLGQPPATLKLPLLLSLDYPWV